MFRRPHRQLNPCKEGFLGEKIFSVFKTSKERTQANWQSDQNKNQTAEVAHTPKLTLRFGLWQSPNVFHGMSENTTRCQVWQ